MMASIAALQERARRRDEEHERRMATEPEYRAEQERLARERTEADERERADLDQRRLETIARVREEKRLPAGFASYLDAWRSGGGSDLPASVVKAHHWVQRFLRGSRGWTFLFLGGPVGVGKTAAALWFLDAPRVSDEPGEFGGEPRRVVRETAGRFVTAEELAKASSYAADYWDGLRDAPRLVIDDLGTETLDAKGHALSNITALLCHRHAHALPAVITLNLTRRAFEERYTAHDGGRLRDRLAESAWFVELTGPSLRRRLSLEEVDP